MTTAWGGFIELLRRNPRTRAYADAVAGAFAAIEAEADENGDALEFRDGCARICRCHVSLAEKVRALTEFMSLRGKVRVRFSSRGARIVMTRL